MANEQPGGARAAGILLMAAAIASVALLANHPGGATASFSDLLKEEAKNQLVDAVVHGGFIAIMILETAGFGTLAMRLGAGKLAAILGLVLFAAGAAAMCGSLVTDGLVLPALAARYVDAPEKIEFARLGFVFGGSMVRFLMPISLLLQSASAAVFGLALLGVSGARLVGGAGLILGALGAAALSMDFGGGHAFILMIVIAGLTLWALLAGLALVRVKV